MDHERSGVDEGSGREITSGSVGNGSSWPFMLGVTGSPWRVLSREMMDIFGFYKIIPATC